MGFSATVLITTKNRKDELRKALQSCLLQKTSAKMEVLVIDDGSDDGTSVMILSDFPTIRLITHRESAGLVKRRNEGTLAAIGNIVFSLDDDAEFSSPNIVEQTLRDFGERHIGAVAIPFCNVNQGKEVFQRPPDDNNLYLIHAFRGTAYAIRKDIFQKLDGYRSYFIHQGEEGDLCLRMFDKGYYVRLGTADIINHYESPKRSLARMDYFGRRNDVLSAYLNTPLFFMPIHMFTTMVNGVIHGIRAGRTLIMLQGLFAGVGACMKYHRCRMPVSNRAYKEYRKLKKNNYITFSDLGIID